LDVVILVADKNMQLGLQGLLGSPQRLGTCNIASKIFVHPKRDPGVLRQCHDFLRPQLRQAAYALVVFDREGCGNPESREALEIEVESRLAQNGWAGRSAAVVVDPELEAWVWGEYSQVGQLLGWSQEGLALREWLLHKGFLQPGQHKPWRPKEALEKTLYTLRKPRSSSLYFELASHVSIDGCIDAAFLKLKSTLRSWFPAEVHI
jgi:hypothetical protein